MAAPYFTHIDRAINNTLITAVQYNDNLDAVQASFELLPLPDDFNLGLSVYRTATNVGNDYTVNIENVISYTDGYVFRFKCPETSTDRARLRINNLPHIVVARDNQVPTIGGDLKADSIYEVVYNSTSGYFNLKSTPSGILDQISLVQSDVNTIFDSFNNRMLGVFSTPPTADNNGNDLVDSAIYTNSIDNQSYVYVSGVWVPQNTYVKATTETPPANPHNGQEWFDPITGVDYTWYEDADGGQWVQQTVTVPQPKVVSDYMFPHIFITTDASADLENPLNFIDATLGNISVTIPTAVGKSGIKVEFKRLDNTGNQVVIQTTNNETIDESVQWRLSYNQTLSVVSDGENWRIV